MENTKATPSPRHRRAAAAIVAAVLAVALVLTGTFAWNTTAGKVNKIRDKGEEKKAVGAVLHDDFEGGIDKHVFVENTSVDEAIYVRIKLQEFMDLTSAKDRPLTPEDWTTHIPKEAISDCESANASAEKFHDNFTWEMGGQKWYLPQPIGTSGTAPSDLNNYDATTPGARQTRNAQVISMADYLAMPNEEKRRFFGWVYDVDGWFYWSKAVVFGETTGLLLQTVSPKASLEDTDYFYAINVIMESVDEADLPMWAVPSGDEDDLGKPSVIDGTQTEVGTKNAVKLLDYVSDGRLTDALQEAHTVKKIKIANPPTKSSYFPGEVFDPSGMTVKVIYKDGRKDLITSGFTFEPSGALAEGTTSVTIAYEGFTAKVPIMVMR